MSAFFTFLAEIEELYFKKCSYKREPFKSSQSYENQHFFVPHLLNITQVPLSFHRSVLHLHQQPIPTYSCNLQTFISRWHLFRINNFNVSKIQNPNCPSCTKKVVFYFFYSRLNYLFLSFSVFFVILSLDVFLILSFL